MLSSPRSMDPGPGPLHFSPQSATESEGFLLDVRGAGAGRVGLLKLVSPKLDCGASAAPEVSGAGLASSDDARSSFGPISVSAPGVYVVCIVGADEFSFSPLGHINIAAAAPASAAEAAAATVAQTGAMDRSGGGSLSSSLGGSPGSIVGAGAAARAARAADAAQNAGGMLGSGPAYEPPRLPPPPGFSPNSAVAFEPVSLRISEGGWGCVQVVAMSASCSSAGTAPDATGAVALPPGEYAVCACRASVSGKMERLAGLLHVSAPRAGPGGGLASQLDGVGSPGQYAAGPSGAGGASAPCVIRGHRILGFRMLGRQGFYERCAFDLLAPGANLVRKTCRVSTAYFGPGDDVVAWGSDSHCAVEGSSLAVLQRVALRGARRSLGNLVDVAKHFS